jgi:flagellar hook protein FlgE
MMPAMYAAISGLQAHQTMLDVTANNLANVDTIGYKAQRTTFAAGLAELLSNGSASSGTNGGTNPMQIGLGVQVGSIDNIMSAGSPQSTGNVLDVAIQGNGFLVVNSGGSISTATPPTYSGGNTQYTRAGNLTTDAQGYLTTASGQYVMGYPTAQDTGTPGTPTQLIVIPPGSTNVAIGPDGSVTYTDSTGAQQSAGYIALASFPNEAGLVRDAGSNWTGSPNSGSPVFGTATGIGFSNTQTISGELEQSNVDMATEFTNMIEAERGYQANSTVISKADQMMQTLVQMAQNG